MNGLWHMCLGLDKKRTHHVTQALWGLFTYQFIGNQVSAHVLNWCAGPLVVVCGVGSDCCCGVLGTLVSLVRKF